MALIGQVGQSVTWRRTVHKLTTTHTCGHDGKLSPPSYPPMAN